MFGKPIQDFSHLHFDPCFRYFLAKHCGAVFSEAQVRPAAATWSADLGEFVLPYDDVRTAAAPEKTLLEFLQTTYDAAASLAGWDREGFKQTFR